MVLLPCPTTVCRAAYLFTRVEARLGYYDDNVRMTFVWLGLFLHGSSSPDS